MRTRNEIFQKEKGKVEFIILFFVFILGLLLTGLIFSPKKSSPFENNSTTEIDTTIGTCCDTGDGDKCKAQDGPDKTLTYNHKQYGLLKSNILFAENFYHLKDTGETFKGNPIIVNSSNEYGILECGHGDDDQIWGKSGKIGDCVAIPNEEIIYVCKKNCGPVTPAPDSWCGKLHHLSCYGQKDSAYDAYFRLDDVTTPGIPDAIKNCNKTSGTTTAPGDKEQILIFPSPNPDKKTLQFESFKVLTIQKQINSSPWVSPYCKPAIYLYPETTMPINVKIAPIGELTLTTPNYPAQGWDVIAEPNSLINYNNSFYPYLYYEAKIPDSNIEKPVEGFVTKYEVIADLFADLLPKLGLNEKETKEFSSYWLHALPKSPFYFVGIVPEENLSLISPLYITPSPKTVIRVTLYFQALNEKAIVKNPTIVTPKRNGFTVVEWGGIFKNDKNHNFSCLM